MFLPWHCCPQFNNPLVDRVLGCSQGFPVRTNTTLNGLGCSALRTYAGICRMDTGHELFFMLSQHTVTPAFCIQCLFGVALSLSASPLGGQQTEAWTWQGQAEWAARRPWPGAAPADRVNQESLPLAPLPLCLPPPSRQAHPSPISVRIGQLSWFQHTTNYHQQVTQWLRRFPLM